MRRSNVTLAAASNAATWTDVLRFTDHETGEPMFIELTAATHPDDITITLRDPSNDSAALEGSMIEGDIAIVDDGVVEFTFSAVAMSGLEPKTYEVGILYDIEDEITQVILGHLPVLKGL